MADNSGFNEDRFQDLLKSGNFLGAYALLKTAHLAADETGILIGILSNQLLAILQLAKAADDREKVQYYRSLLNYVLQDFPGLASLYREQIRSGSRGAIPDMLQDVWQEFNDILAGRKTLDEEFRQRLQEVQQHVRESDMGTKNVEQFIKKAESEIARGVDNLRDFLHGIFEKPASSTSAPPGSENPPESDRSDGSARKTSKKVKIEDADDPLPKDIHKADLES